MTVLHVLHNLFGEYFNNLLYWFFETPLATDTNSPSRQLLPFGHVGMYT